MAVASLVDPAAAVASSSIHGADVTPNSGATQAVTSLAMRPLIPLGKHMFVSWLEKLVEGEVVLVDQSANGEAPVSMNFGTTAKGTNCALRAQITVRDAKFYARLVLRGDLGFAEAFMKCEVDVSDLTTLFLIFLKNQSRLSQLTTQTAVVSNVLSYLAHSRLANTIANSWSNISAHYDLGNELFQSFLDESMMYSSAVWADPEESLYTAQMRKLQMMMDKAKLEAHHEVLEIGTGWGTFAIEMVKQRGCRVTTVTLSKEQHDFALERIQALPIEQASRITLLLTDYRSLPELFPEKRFDRIVSIEMMEAVGAEFLPTFFQVVDRMLHREHGIFVFQCITMPEDRYEAYCHGADFIQTYIFPGGHCPSVHRLITSCEEGSRSQLTVDHVENIGMHYARTLRVWREVFVANYQDKLAPFPKYVESSKEQPSSLLSWLSPTKEFTSVEAKREPFYSEEFRRKWMYYFAYCEAGFVNRSIGNVQMVVTRSNNGDFLKGLETIVL